MMTEFDLFLITRHSVCGNVEIMNQERPDMKDAAELWISGKLIISAITARLHTHGSSSEGSLPKTYNCQLFNF